MNNYDRIAEYCGFKNWDDMVELAKDSPKELKIPPYLFYCKPNIGLNFCFGELFETIKKINFKLTVDNDKVFLTRDKKEDIIEPNNNTEDKT